MLIHNMRECLGLQNSKTETASNCDLLFVLHIEIPDNKPWENSEGEVSSDKPC